MALERDYILNKRYRIIEILGQGGMGAVYRAEDINLGLEVAVKENLFTSDEYVRQFRREATILASLRHGNLPRVSDHFEIDEQGQYLVMDFIEGEDLRQRMDRVGLLVDAEVIVSAAVICDALQYLHTRTPPILHRDIKPGNIKITPDGGAFLVDFGLAKIAVDSQVTTTGARAMTPGYSSPEQYGTARTDSRSDIYSLGATVYAALSGSIPEDGLARAMDQVDLTPIRKRNPKVSRKLAAVLEKSLEIHPDDRYQNADHFKEELLLSNSSTKRWATQVEMTITPPPEDAVTRVGEGEVNQDPTPSGEIRKRRESNLRRKKRMRRRLGLTLFFGLLIGVLSWTWLDFSDINVLSLVGLTSVTPQTAALVDQTSTPIPTESSSTLEVPGESVNPSETPQAEMTTLDGNVTPTLFPIAGFTPTVTPTLVIGPVGGEKLAFASTRTGETQVWLHDFIEDSSEQLTFIEGGACQPEWSPDGRRLAFVSPCQENQNLYTSSQIFVIDIESRDITLLPVEVGSFDPDWSPDGKKLLYTFATDANLTQIELLDLESGTSEPLIIEEGLNFNPDWSPSGESLVFVSTSAGGFRLFLLDNFPGAEILSFSRSGSFDNLSPVWHPFGEKIVFNQKPLEGGVLDLVSIGLNMLGIPIGEYFEEPIGSSSLIVKVDPAYSSDGLWIAYESWPDGENHDIYILFQDESNEIRVTSDPAFDFDPAWQPIP